MDGQRTLGVGPGRELLETLEARFERHLDRHRELSWEAVRTTFDAEGEHSPETQRAGWQAISDTFGRYVESKVSG